MGGQAAEQIIAGVVLSERLAVTMYGAIHRAQFMGQRNLRGLVVDPKILEDDSFRIALTDAKTIATVTKLEHGNIVPTVGVESGGPDVVIVTRGVGRYVTVQDLIAAAKAKSKQGGKLAMPVAGLIGRSVIEALAAAHKAGVIHGAVHPRSVLIDEDGGVRLTDFIVGHALTKAVAQGADSSLWRGLTGYIAPELVVGEDPTPAVDVFAVGAMLFTMLSGEVPPGSLRVTPAVERLVQRALDTDSTRRYKTATDLLENLVEAMEDDRWELADRGELIREAGLSQSDANIDDATEDLLASLGGASQIQVTRSSRPGSDRIGSVLNDLDNTGMTQVDPRPFRRDPISDIIRQDPREREAIVSRGRVPSLDDPDDDATPLPPPSPSRESFSDLPLAPPRRSSPAVGTRGGTSDEAAALAAIDSLDEGAKRVTTAAEQAAAAAAKLEQAAARAERAAVRAETGDPAKRSAPRAAPIVDVPDMHEPPPKLKSPVRGVIGTIVILGLLGAAGYGIYYRLHQDDAQAQAAKEAKERAEQEAADKTKAAQEALPDPGAIDITADAAGIWLQLGKTPVDVAIALPATQQHDLVLLKDGFEPTEAQINGTTWKGSGKSLAAKLDVTLKPGKAGKTAELPLQPTTPVLGTTGIVGAGKVHVDSSPSDAAVWLFIGANHAHFENLWAGRDYTVAVVKPGFKTEVVEFKADDWRDNDPSTPIDSAKKKAVLEKKVELQPDPNARPEKKGH
ncbi:MAG: protein kinase [Deltaproteobacteria bacterium]|nr:protein kinase [Deltaproteobacteria bacterium]